MHRVIDTFSDLKVESGNHSFTTHRVIDTFSDLKVERGNHSFITHRVIDTFSDLKARITRFSDKHSPLVGCSLSQPISVERSSLFQPISGERSSLFQPISGVIISANQRRADDSRH
ncbi:hypothetical protein RRG08_051859 [Elysia crispata]|uniref:Uncharacterized protein n=1 Tax=Elysia crispata TaxID=231223 RepID=A0AAE0Z9Q7_9GAST|nr:hypothetical protein RRG08_051859 [Elysia crispata]